jgi:LPPG:FO 2-phospho-L-lactate transferase
MRVLALAGGVGGAKLADGLAQALLPEELTIVVNTGDDFKHLGLYICPDLDTVCYTLAGIANPATGWGRANETWKALESVGALGGPTWFRIGDRDLGLHLERTRRLEAGEQLSQILPFQEYFVHRQCHPRVSGFRFADVKQAHPAPGVLAAMREADLVVICPSNPWVSVDPILSIPGVRPTIDGQLVVAVSPIVGGQAIKGPAAKMYAELGIEPSALAVARHYGELLEAFMRW